MSTGTLHDASRAEFEAWWQTDGQYSRAGGGDYEKTFAFNAWQASRKAERDEIISELAGMTCNNATARSAVKECIATIKEMK
ncbi:hypothetical protein [Rhodoferax ferrireducens]|uniref:hypothetical protein n=1 Tax=Rhodoferax ferrireducens TaxID=192843 RepID=UPI000E0DC424|nr:hypothetical protein [Rhodoferax ferrireducens]